MKLDRFRAPALAAGAVLLISGAGIAFAGSPSAAAPAPAAPVVAEEPVGPDTDTLQEGDQTTPDAGAAAVPAVKAIAVTAPTAKAAVTAPATKAAVAASSETAPEAPEGVEAPEGAETPGTEADGPGGHEDPAGQNVDHQFEGEE